MFCSVRQSDCFVECVSGELPISAESTSKVDEKIKRRPVVKKKVKGRSSYFAGVNAEKQTVTEVLFEKNAGIDIYFIDA